jgi:hypothetical protein
MWWIGVDALKPHGFFNFNQMKKTFYFSHDFEPTSDPKIQALISEYGGLGYGIWWRIIEMLHSDDDHKLPKKQFLYRAIAGQMKCEYVLIEEFIDFAINVLELLNTDGNYFWSNRVFKNFEQMDKERGWRSKGGINSANARKLKEADLNSSATELNLTSTELNSSSCKEKKRKEIVYTPTIDEVELYFKDNGYTKESAIKAYNFYDVANWVDSKGNKVKNWKQKMQGVWFKDENKAATLQYIDFRPGN